MPGLVILSVVHDSPINRAEFLSYFSKSFIVTARPGSIQPTSGSRSGSAEGIRGSGRGTGAPPSLCWITLGGIGQKRLDVNGQIRVREYLSLTVSFDHNMLDAAPDVRTLSLLPGNRLERLKGDRQGQYSIRINDQWRLCFTWRDGNAYEVEIVDYH